MKIERKIIIILVIIIIVLIISIPIIIFTIQNNAKKAPGAPIDLQIIEGNKQITLSWDPPLNNGGSAITGYKIYNGTFSGEETYLITLGNVTNYTVTGLTNGHIYYYEVSAINNIGDSPKSMEINGTPSTTPTAPLNLKAKIEHESIFLTWNVPLNNGGANITGYIIYRGTKSDNISYYTSVGNVLNYTDSNLSNIITTYYYKVSAVNKDGHGNLSTDVSIVYPEKHIDGPSFIVIISVSFLAVICVTYSCKKGKTRKNFNIYR